MWVCETGPDIPWIHRQGKKTNDQAEVDNRKYKPFWTQPRYNIKYRNDIGNNGIDGQTEKSNKYNSEVHNNSDMVENEKAKKNDQTEEDQVTEGLDGQTTNGPQTIDSTQM